MIRIDNFYVKKHKTRIDVDWEGEQAGDYINLFLIDRYFIFHVFNLL
jgi:hypothetical protein